MAATLQGLKLYAVIEHDADDALLDGLLNAAKAYLFNAGVPEEMSGALYDTACYMLAYEWYQDRGAGKVTETLRRAVDSVIWQLRYMQPPTGGDGNDTGE